MIPRVASILRDAAFLRVIAEHQGEGTRNICSNFDIQGARHTFDKVLSSHFLSNLALKSVVLGVERFLIETVGECWNSSVAFFDGENQEPFIIDLRHQVLELSLFQNDWILDIIG